MRAICAPWIAARFGTPASHEHAVEAILMAVWTADDWSAAIREPRLAADEPLDAEKLADWQRRLAQGSCQSGASLPRFANQTAMILMRFRSGWKR